MGMFILGFVAGVSLMFVAFILLIIYIGAKELEQAHKDGLDMPL